MVEVKNKDTTHLFEHWFNSIQELQCCLMSPFAYLHPEGKEWTGMHKNERNERNELTRERGGEKMRRWKDEGKRGEDSTKEEIWTDAVEASKYTLKANRRRNAREGYSTRSRLNVWPFPLYGAPSTYPVDTQPTVHATWITTCPMPLPISRKSLLHPNREDCTTASSMKSGFMAPYIALIFSGFDRPFLVFGLSVFMVVPL